MSRTYEAPPTAVECWEAYQRGEWVTMDHLFALIDGLNPTPVAAPPRTGDDAEMADELDEIAAAVRVLENCYFPLIKRADWVIQFRTSERVKELAARLSDSRGGR